MKKLLLIFILTIFAPLCANAAPEWVNDSRQLFAGGRAMIYVVNMRTFASIDDNKNEIIEIEKGETPGNFLNAIKKLDSLKENGINMVHLLPITPVGKLKALGTAGSLYAMDSFSEINPQLDDLSNPMRVNEEAKKFIEEAHRRGIRVIVDLPSCGSYDMYLRRPELFVLGNDGKPIVPADWTDVRLFKTLDKDKSVNQELFELHKGFIDMVQGIGADGVRADVATIKPYEFWQMLIAYARKNDPQFLFVAEASPEWKEAPAKEAPFTTYDKLVSAGFDGYLGNFMNYLKFTETKDLFSAYKEARKLSERYGEDKNIVLNFATHDDVSTMFSGYDYISQIIWLSATLPGNAYFVNGFITGDFYVYGYSNKHAEKTYTDDEYYHTHKGKLDIFNFSRQPGGVNVNIAQEFRLASAIRAKLGNMLNTEPNILSTGHPDIFAYEYAMGNAKLVVALNHSTNMHATGKISLKGVKDFAEILPLKLEDGAADFNKGKMSLRLRPSGIIVFMTKNNNFSGKK